MNDGAAGAYANCVSSFPIRACSRCAGAWPPKSLKLVRNSEDDALSWIEAVSEFDPLERQASDEAR